MVREGRSWSGRERNCCFLNTRDRRFATISAVSGLDVPDDSRAVAVTDWDLDGRPDLWISSRTSPRLRFFHNRTASANHTLTVRLRGVRCNRDAIGARLELSLGRKGETKRIKTLRAGEGFLSQSSKWVHFGLGKETHIDGLTVHWPGGAAEAFNDLRPDTRYLLEQDTGRAVVWTLEDRNVQLVPSDVKVPPTREGSRTVALSRPIVPSIQYRDFSGRSVSLADMRPNHDGVGTKAILVNLWATWCSPCLRELKELTRDEERLRAAGVDIVALCVDEVADGGSADLSRARQFLDEIHYPFRSGVADHKVVQDLDTLHRSLVDLQLDLPVPSSYLIDSDRQLVVLYKGPLTSRQLLDDLCLLDASAERVRDSAVPFRGTWITKPLRPYPQDIALKYVERGDTDDAVHYLRTYLRRAAEMSNDATIADLADVHFLLGRLLTDRGDTAEGMSAYEEAVRINPQYRKAHINLGEILLRQNRAAEAIAHFDAALQIEPDDGGTWVAMGVAQVQNRQPRRATRCYQEALRLDPHHPQARANLARLLHAQGDRAQAAALYREILKDQPESASNANNLAWILASSHDQSVYNPTEAVTWAEKACRATEHQDPRFLTTLAAAYSETGRFKDAILTAKTAIRLAYASGQPQIATAVEKHVRYYEAGQSYRQGRGQSSR